MNRKTIALALGLAAVLVAAASAPVFAGPAQAAKLGIRWFGVGGPRSAVNDAAKILNMVPEEVLAAKRSGKTLGQIAEEKGMTSSELADRIVAVRTQKVETLVAEGKITRQVADSALANLKENIKAAVDKEPLGRCAVGEGTGCGGQGGCGTKRGQGPSHGDSQGQGRGAGGQGKGARGSQATRAGR